MKLFAKVNSGAAGLIWVAGYFILLALVAISKEIAAQYAIAITGWTGGLVAVLLKNNASNKLDIEAAKMGEEKVDILNTIKVRANGPECEKTDVV